jgi:hypothetical protein
MAQRFTVAFAAGDGLIPWSVKVTCTVAELAVTVGRVSLPPRQVQSPVLPVLLPEPVLPLDPLPVEPPPVEPLPVEPLLPVLFPLAPVLPLELLLEAVGVPVEPPLLPLALPVLPPLEPLPVPALVLLALEPLVVSPVLPDDELDEPPSSPLQPESTMAATAAAQII